MKLERLGSWNRQLHGLFERYKFVLLVILVGVVLLLLPSVGNKQAGKAETDKTNGRDPFLVEELEQKLETALSRVEGAGEVRVVLTLKSSARQILAQNSQSTSREGAQERQSETVVISRGTGMQEPVALQQISPQYQGALVVCSGGDDPAVRLRLVEAVADLTGLGSDRISVCKGK